MAEAVAFLDPAAYAGEPICPCCGSGWPCCADLGRQWTHEQTCARYAWAAEVCDGCAKQFDLEQFIASTLPARPAV